MKFEISQTTANFCFAAYRDEEKLAELSGKVFAENIACALETVFMQSSEHGRNALEVITDKFKNYIRQNDMAVYCFDNERFQKPIEYLDAVGFERQYQKFIYKKDLSQNLEKPIESFSLKSLNEMEQAVFQNIFYQCIQGDDYANPKNLSPIEFYENEVKSASDCFDPSIWYVVFLNDEPLGVLLCRVEKHNLDKIEGNFNYFGLMPKFRSKGLGTKLLSHGLFLLQNLGCTEYLGFTNQKHTKMQMVFDKNDCMKFAEQIVFEL